MRKIVVDLMCWDFSIGGEHYTGNVIKSDVGYEKTEIRQVMGSGLAGRLNKKDGGRSNRPGDTTARFETEGSAIKHGIKLALKKHPDVDYILAGSACSARPEKMVWCADETLMAKANKIWTEFDAFYDHTNDPWSEHEARMMELINIWDDLLK